MIQINDPMVIPGIAAWDPLLEVTTVPLLANLFIPSVLCLVGTIGAGDGATVVTRCDWCDRCQAMNTFRWKTSPSIGMLLLPRQE